MSPPSFVFALSAAEWLALSAFLLALSIESRRRGRSA